MLGLITEPKVQFKWQLTALTLLLCVAQEALAQPSASAAANKPGTAIKNSTVLDPSVIDPVGKLAQISNSVAHSSEELASISKAMDELNDQLARVEKERPVKVTRAEVDALQKRFKETIDRSYVVEKNVKDALAKDQRDIENVHHALTAIQAERTAGSKRKVVMSDGEITECLKDLNDLKVTIRSLQQSLTDDQAKPAKQAAKDRPANKKVSK